MSAPTFHPTLPFSLSAQKKHGMPHQHYVIPQSELTASLIPMSLWVSEYVDFIYKCSAKFSTSGSQQLAHLSVCRLYSEYFSWNQLAATAENVADETNCLCVRLRTLLCLQACMKYFLKCIWHKSYSEKKSISMLKPLCSLIKNPTLHKWNIFYFTSFPAVCTGGLNFPHHTCICWTLDQDVTDHSRNFASENQIVFNELVKSNTFRSKCARQLENHLPQITNVTLFYLLVCCLLFTLW